MKVIIAFAAFVAIAAALPTNSDAAATIVNSKNTTIGIGPWQWGSETSNGIKQNDSGGGEVLYEETENAVRGSFKWTAPDGQIYTVNYVADNDVFQPDALHLPKNP